MQMCKLPLIAAWAVAILGLAGCGCSSPHGTTQPPGDADPDGTLPPPGDAGPAIGPLRVDPQNHRYFTAGNGKAVYLTGSHTWSNFKDRAHVDPPPAFDYPGFLDFLIAHHHNFIRLWTWEQTHSYDDDPNNLLYFTPFAWQRTGPGTATDGKPRFDLDKLDPAYFTRLHDRVAAARDRGIYVSVMLFDGWDLVNGYNATDGGYPFAQGNNVNSVAIAGAAAFSVGNAITARQQAYVRAVIDAVDDLDNVLYEIANETDASAVAWQYQMVDFVKSYEATKPMQHPVGMTSTYPGSDAALFASANHADWISPSGQLVAGDGRKVILNDTDHSYGWTQLKADGPAAQRAWAWETFCIGAAPMFMDPYLEVWAGRNNPSGGRLDPTWNTIRDALGFTHIYADRLNLERALPSPSLCSTGYCLAEPGHQYLVYQPSSGAFTLNVLAGAYQLEWFNPATGRVAQSGMTTLPAEQHTFTPPFSGDAVLLLLQ
ncbi:MAG: hypothetical protein E6J90_50100 [Deltaproteobacteria bacterium]|nr:MAG: hypothetical protein E6J90_50100 [Deltaproteobacteria bacterium]TMQ10937.1 MAG: hypothetical protein E6J91_24645 [Deltaproteobacteria bacterium]